MSLAAKAVRGLRIAGAAAAWPSDLAPLERAELGNDDVHAALLGPGWRAELARRGHDPERPERAWGVRRRQWARGLEPPVDSARLAARAAERALERAGVRPGDLDAVFAATCTPPGVTSTLAARVARELGADAAAHDVRAGGAGGLAAWLHASWAHAAGCRTSLVVAAEVVSPYLGAHDLADALLFADGAGALVLASDPSSEGGLLGAVCGNAAVCGTPFTVPGALPPRAREVEEGAFLFRAPDARYVEGLAEVWARAADALRAVTGGPPERFLPYAVTAPQVRTAAERAGADPAPALDFLARRGCPGCAGPLAMLAESLQAAPPEPGTTLGSAAVGGGVSWAALAWRAGPTDA